MVLKTNRYQNSYSQTSDLSYKDLYYQEMKLLKLFVNILIVVYQKEYLFRYINFENENKTFNILYPVEGPFSYLTL